MNRYRIEYTTTEVRVAIVDAEDENAAYNAVAGDQSLGATWQDDYLIGRPGGNEIRDCTLIGKLAFE